MSRQLRIKLAVLSLALLLIAVSAYSSRTLPRIAQPAETDTASESISAYRKWTLVNPIPVRMERAAAQLCAARQPVMPQNPHEDKFISVYVNEAGRLAMMQQLVPEFPVGSVIVKEKLGMKDRGSPELLTAMIKREKGYNPQSGDWEYLVLDGTGTKITERGKLVTCAGCHQAYDKTDYVTRIYLTDEARRQLK